MGCLTQQYPSRRKHIPCCPNLAWANKCGRDQRKLKLCPNKQQSEHLHNGYLILKWQSARSTPFRTSIYRAVSLELPSCRTWEVKHFCYQIVDEISESHYHKDKKMGSLTFSTMNTSTINYTLPYSPSEKCAWFSSSSLSSFSSMIMKKCGKNDKISLSAFWKNCL